VTDHAPTLSIVVPALDEQDNVGPLVEQVESAVRGAGVDAELIVVDDGSADATPRRLAELAAARPWLRVLRREHRQGQSAAMYAGIHAARGAYVATLDADLQNDPAELPAMLEKLTAEGADLVQGDRSRARQDNIVRRYGSVVGRVVRRGLLGDRVRDTGCSSRVMSAALARRLPLQFKGVHRFIPAYAAAVGAKIVEVPVRHRPRHAGTTKYGLGVLNRGAAGLADTFAVRWMSKRVRDTSAAEAAPPAPAAGPPGVTVVADAPAPRAVTADAAERG